MSQLREGLVHVEPLVGVVPQRMNKRCPASRKVRWCSKADVIAIWKTLGETGSYYHCKRCGYWHVSSQPFYDTVTGTEDLAPRPEAIAAMWQHNHSHAVNGKREQALRYAYARSAGELAWAWLEHVLHDGPRPDGEVADVRELLDRAMSVGRE